MFLQYLQSQHKTFPFHQVYKNLLLLHKIVGNYITDHRVINWIRATLGQIFIFVYLVSCRNMLSIFNVLLWTQLVPACGLIPVTSALVATTCRYGLHTQIIYTSPINEIQHKHQSHTRYQIKFQSKILTQTDSYLRGKQLSAENFVQFKIFWTPTLAVMRTPLPCS